MNSLQKPPKPTRRHARSGETYTSYDMPPPSCSLGAVLGTAALTLLTFSAISRWMQELLPFGDALTRDAGMICGQAIVAAADTAMIAAVTAAIGSYAPITTVDIASRFLRPLGAEGGDFMVEILKPGRRLVVGRITINDCASGKLAADLSSTYARL